MLRHPERILIAVGAMVLLALVALQCSALWRNSREIVARQEAVRQLEAEIEKNDFPPPRHDAAEHAGRVFAAWENLPLTEPLDEWDFYPKPGARH